MNKLILICQEQLRILAEDLRQKIRRRCDYMVPGELKKPYKHFARNRKDENGSIMMPSNIPYATVTQADLSIAIKDLGIFCCMYLCIFTCICREQI
jgi:hypothetical protein